MQDLQSATKHLRACDRTCAATCQSLFLMATPTRSPVMVHCSAVWATRYRSAGLADVKVNRYAAARHEIMREINRAEVTADTIGWLSARAA